MGRHISSRFWARKYSRVRSSAGKMEVVAPSSAPMLVMVLRSGTLSEATPSPQYSKILPTPPFTLRRRSSSKMMSLAATQGCSRPARGARPAQPAGADRQHAGAARGRRVAVGAEEHVAGRAKPLQVYLVADAVARPREVDAVLGCDGLQEAVVVGVLEAGLEHVVVNV